MADLEWQVDIKKEFTSLSRPLMRRELSTENVFIRCSSRFAMHDGSAIAAYKLIFAPGLVMGGNGWQGRRV
jgi:hypothetical protein